MTEIQWQVKPAALRRGDQTIGYAAFIADEKGRVKEWAIKEDAIRNTEPHAYFTWPQTPESAMARYEEAEELGEIVTAARPYAPLIRSVPLPADE